ncbi:MAG: A/G-specific adenine glycosylase [Sphingomonas sp.]
MPDNIATALLGWYDANARDLPWRAPPGAPAPDPYRVWLSEVMLQQTQVASARPYFEKFTARWPDFASLAAADDAELMAAWAGLGYYARARNLLACAREVAALGRLPDAEEGLRKLPGIGGYTAAAIAAIAFGRRAVVVDANVERVVARLFALADPLPGAKPRIHALTDSVTPDARAGDFAQAMMDLGATICTARAPRCLLCPLRPECAGFATGAPEVFPVKAAKPDRPQRHGTIFWAEREGHVLLVRRPARGLLGGMRALPTGPWSDAPPGLAGAPFAAGWRLLDAGVTHGFTHFRLDCALAAATIAEHSGAVAGEWWPVDGIESAGLPTLFAKAAKAFGRVG